MKKIENVVVALDYSAADKTLITYILYLNQFLDFKKIDFVHVKNGTSESFVIYDDKIEFLLNPESDGVEPKKSGQQFTVVPKNTTVHSVKIEGQPIKSILEYCKKHSADLLVVATKHQSHGSGVTSTNLSRKASCDVLFVPELYRAEAKNILVPFDFSVHSKGALELSTVFTSKESVVHCYHIFDTITANQSNYEELEEKHRKEKLEEFSKYLHSSNIDSSKIIPDFEPNEAGIVDQLTAKIEDGDYQLVIIGSRGKSNASAILFGSVAESITGTSQKCPLYIVKRKGETLDILSSLFGA